MTTIDLDDICKGCKFIEGDDTCSECLRLIIMDMVNMSDPIDRFEEDEK